MSQEKDFRTLHFFLDGLMPRAYYGRIVRHIQEERRMKDKEQDEAKRAFFEQVRGQLDALVKERDQVETDIETLEERRGDLTGQIKGLLEYLREAGAPPMFFGIIAKTEDESFTRLSKTRAARKLLYPEKALSTEELHAEMVKRGYRFRGKRPVSNLSAALNNSAHFQRRDDGKWILTDRDKEW